MNEQFMTWLKDTPAAMGRFLRVIEQFVQEQAQPVQLPETTGTGPATFKVGGSYELKSVPISESEINDLFKGMAEAVTREKAFEYIKGFVQAVLLVGGAA